MKSNNALIVILGTVTLDAGHRLTVIVLGASGYRPFRCSIASHYGVLRALYALMRFYAHPFSEHCPTLCAALVLLSLPT